MSPSTRRAWIEIALPGAWGRSVRVALHPEGVDRNVHSGLPIEARRLSPSTRRAWIEMRRRSVYNYK